MEHHPEIGILQSLAVPYAVLSTRPVLGSGFVRYRLVAIPEESRTPELLRD